MRPQSAWRNLRPARVSVALLGSLILATASVPAFATTRYATPSPPESSSFGAQADEGLVATAVWNGTLGAIDCVNNPWGNDPLEYQCAVTGDTQFHDSPPTLDLGCRETFAATAGPEFSNIGNCWAKLGWDSVEEQEIGFPAQWWADGDVNGESCHDIRDTSSGVMIYHSDRLGMDFEIIARFIDIHTSPDGAEVRFSGDGFSTDEDRTYIATFSGTVVTTEDFPCQGPEKSADFTGTVEIVKAPQPNLGDFAFHEYSKAHETDGRIGVEQRRPDRWARNVPLNGCTAPVAGSPVYQTQWARDTAGENWVEIGTGNQCGGNFRYHFWGFGHQLDFTLVGFEMITGTGMHTFEVSRLPQGSTWNFRIDAQTKGTHDWGRFFDLSSVGLESYAHGAKVHPYDGEFLLYRGATSTGWFAWSGEDLEEISNAEMCGRWLDEGETWRAGQNESTFC